MSLDIWTQCAGASEIRPLDRTAWRAVEAQHQVSTRKLVDSLEEQALLEQLIDTAKPPDPGGGRLHVLVSTPFRYPPLAHGSRFGRRREPGLWYGSETPRALFAEVAYYRFVFLDGTEAPLDTLRTWHSVFTLRLRTRRGIDLTSRPFAPHASAIASPSDYRAPQALGTAMRRAGVEAFRYPSARDPGGGVNVGVFTPRAFGAARPRGLETWHCTATRQRVEIVRQDFSGRTAFTYAREVFLVDGRLPAPAL
jgi:hypothetical protein